MAQKKRTKKMKVRDLKPSKDAKGGLHRMQGGTGHRVQHAGRQQQ
jgi:hypothetical protein